MKSVLYVEDKMKVPVKYWIDEDKLEPKCKEQILNLSNLPFAFKHIAILIIIRKSDEDDEDVDETYRRRVGDIVDKHTILEFEYH